MSYDKAIGDKIFNTAYAYFKSLQHIDEYYSSTNIDSIDKFLPTLQLQSISFRRGNEVNDNTISFSFRTGLGVVGKIEFRQPVTEAQ